MLWFVQCICSACHACRVQRAANDQQQHLDAAGTAGRIELGPPDKCHAWRRASALQDALKINVLRTIIAFTAAPNECTLLAAGAPRSLPPRKTIGGAPHQCRASGTKLGAGRGPARSVMALGGTLGLTQDRARQPAGWAWDGVACGPTAGGACGRARWRQGPVPSRLRRGGGRMLHVAQISVTSVCGGRGEGSHILCRWFLTIVQADSPSPCPSPGSAPQQPDCPLFNATSPKTHLSS